MTHGEQLSVWSESMSATKISIHQNVVKPAKGRIRTQKPGQRTSTRRHATVFRFLMVLTQAHLNWSMKITPSGTAIQNVNKYRCPSLVSSKMEGLISRPFLDKNRFRLMFTCLFSQSQQLFFCPIVTLLPLLLINLR